MQGGGQLGIIGESELPEERNFHTYLDFRALKRPGADKHRPVGLGLSQGVHGAVGAGMNFHGPAHLRNFVAAEDEREPVGPIQQGIGLVGFLF